MKNQKNLFAPILILGLLLTSILSCDKDDTNSSNNEDNVNECVDVDGNVYETIVIGEQEWMAENLRVTKYNNGDAIPTGLNDDDWENTTDGNYAIYPHASIDGLNSEAEVLEAYGALYNWYAVDDVRGLCPVGWRMPSNEDWKELANYIGNENPGNILKSCRQVGSPEGGECDTNVHPRWDSHDTHYGTNDYWFAALPAGYRLYGAMYLNVGYVGFWWTSTEDDVEYGAWPVVTASNSGRLYIEDEGMDKVEGLSVRCIKD